MRTLFIISPSLVSRLLIQASPDDTSLRTSVTDLRPTTEPNTPTEAEDMTGPVVAAGMIGVTDTVMMMVVVEVEGLAEGNGYNY